jgi:pimeloyl-ACP methyl ester carboxylesterase
MDRVNALPALVIDEAGSGRPALIVHGGGGPLTVAPLSAHLAETMRALTLTLPGWNGAPRPESMRTIAGVADACLAWLGEQDLTDVLVVGSSIGGWIAAELGVRDRDTRISGLVLIDAVGIEVPDEPITDFFALDPRGVVEHSFHDPDRFFVDPATLTPEQIATQQANMASLRAVAGDPYMHDPALDDRLADVRLPTPVIWGDSDGIVTPAYGRAYAGAFRRATPSSSSPTPVTATDRAARRHARADRRVRGAARFVAVRSRLRPVRPWGSRRRPPARS